jgi:hypothetical protein
LFEPMNSLRIDVELAWDAQQARREQLGGGRRRSSSARPSC